jgi:HSP20 family protein
MAYPSRFLGRDIDSLRREMDRLFQDFTPRGAGDSDSDQAVWAPRADLAETEDSFVIVLDVPGVREEELQLTLEEDTLKVAGERRFAREGSDSQFHRIERSYGRFFRAFRFGSPIDASGVDADFQDGVLTVRVPKAEASKPRRIQVRTRGVESETAGRVSNGSPVEAEANGSATNGN